MDPYLARVAEDIESQFPARAVFLDWGSTLDTAVVQVFGPGVTFRGSRVIPDAAVMTREALTTAVMGAVSGILNPSVATITGPGVYSDGTVVV